MTPEQVFHLSSNFAVFGWLTLILGGKSKIVANSLGKYVFPGLLSAVYLVLVAQHWAGHAGGFNSLNGVAQLFSNPWLLTAGWVHYLAFDLFLGGWQVRDAAHHGIAHWWTVPTLIVTFLFGPIGFLLYLGLRSVLNQVSRPQPGKAIHTEMT